MVDTIEAAGDITLDKPRRASPSGLHIPQRGMTASPRPVGVRIVRELRLIVRFEKHANYFADQLIGPCRQPQRSQFTLLFRDVDPAGRFEPVPLSPQFPDDRVDHYRGHTVGGPAI